MIRHPPISTLFPYTRSSDLASERSERLDCTSTVSTPAVTGNAPASGLPSPIVVVNGLELHDWRKPDRKSTRLNSSHRTISYAVFCLKKKKKITHQYRHQMTI